MFSKIHASCFYFEIGWPVIPVLHRARVCAGTLAQMLPDGIDVMSLTVLLMSGKRACPVWGTLTYRCCFICGRPPSASDATCLLQLQPTPYLGHPPHAEHDHPRNSIQKSESFMFPRTDSKVLLNQGGSLII